MLMARDVNLAFATAVVRPAEMGLFALLPNEAVDNEAAVVLPVSDDITHILTIDPPLKFELTLTHLNAPLMSP